MQETGRLKFREEEKFITVVRSAYLCICVFIVLLFAGYRAAPVYGKLDFLLLDSKPWWPQWRPMVIDVIKQGKQPVYTDRTTSTVLSGAFGQETVFFRFSRPPVLNLDKMELVNKPRIEMLPAGALILLFGDENRQTTNKVFLEYVNATKPSNGKEGGSAMKEVFPYRCIINVQGFIPSWVSFETGHWNPKFADTKVFYRYGEMNAQEVVSELRENPPQNCKVFF